MELERLIRELLKAVERDLLDHQSSVERGPKDEERRQLGDAIGQLTSFDGLIEWFEPVKDVTTGGRRVANLVLARNRPTMCESVTPLEKLVDAGSCSSPLQTALPNAYWHKSLGLKGLLNPYHKFREC
jgi:hypothetical protein